MIFLISLIICIILHESAHLLTAKMVKCKVEVFSIGFGKQLFSFTYKGTKYRIALIPIGGYNKLEHEIDYCRNKNALPNLPYRKKLLVILSGCYVNIITGLMGYFLGMKFNNYNLCYFGWISTLLGITNLLPIPALDGSYPILFLMEKVIPKKYALQLMRFLITWGFILLMTLNILCLPYLVYLIRTGRL